MNAMLLVADTLEAVQISKNAIAAMIPAKMFFILFSFFLGFDLLLEVGLLTFYRGC